MLKRLALITMARGVDRLDDVVGRRTRGGPAAGRRGSGGRRARADAPADRGAQPQPGHAAAPRGRTSSHRRQPIFRAGINFVRVDVIATDNKGNPILDLKPEDLTVTEDGKPQAIESFKLIKVDDRKETTPPREIRTSFDEESEAQREDVRLFAIFLDDYHVRRGASMYARQPLMRFLQNQLQPTDMVALMYPLTPLSDVVMSRNHEALARAVERFDGRKFDYTPRNQFEEKYANYPAERRRADAQRGVALGAAIARDAHGLASRGAQGRDPRQRGLLQLSAAAAARPDCHRCPGSATRHASRPVPAPARTASGSSAAPR